MRTRDMFLLGIAVLAAVGGVGAYIAGQRQARPPAATGTPAARPLELSPVEIATVAPRDLREIVRFTGSTQPVDQTIVKSRVAAKLAEVLVREGDRVAIGQVVARFETTDATTRLNERLSALEAARAEARWAEKDRSDKERLFDQKVVAQAALAQATAVADAKKSMVAVNEAQVELARKALADAEVRAPMAGIVGERLANPGESLPVDGRILTLLDTTRVEIAAQVPAADVVRLKVDQPVTASVEGFPERAFRARVARISPTTQAGSRSVLVFVEILDGDPALRGGLFGTGEAVVAERRGAIALPVAALRRDEGGEHVLALRDGRLTRVAVKAGARWDRGELVEVEGVAAGERVVVAPLPGLKAGQAVKVEGAK